MNQQRTAKCLYTVVLAAHSDTCIDLELSVSDPIRSWTLLGCLIGALMLSILVLILVCCGCGGSRSLARNLRTHELVNYQALDRSGSPAPGRRTTSFAAGKQVTITKEGRRGQIQLLLSSTSDDGKHSASGLVLSSGEDNEVYARDSDVECPALSQTTDSTAKTPLLASTTFSSGTRIPSSGSPPDGGQGSLAKHVRIVLPSDSDEEGPDFV